MNYIFSLFLPDAGKEWFGEMRVASCFRRSCRPRPSCHVFFLAPATIDFFPRRLDATRIIVPLGCLYTPLKDRSIGKETWLSLMD